MSTSSLTKSNTAPAPQGLENASSIFLDEEHIPRMIIDSAQNILFCNQALNTICGNIEGAHISEIFSLEKKISEGINVFTLKNTQTAFSFQIDWVPTPNGDKFMIASTEASTEQEKLKQYVDEKVNKSSDINAAPFIDLSFDACCITNANGHFITINENFTTLFGYDLNELKNKNIYDLIHANHKGQFQQNLSSLSHNKIEAQSAIETYCLDKEGKTRWVEWKNKSVNGKIYSTGRDLTPLKSYKESLQRKQKKLSEAEAIGHIGQWEWKVGGDTITFSDQLYSIFGVDAKDFTPSLDNITNMIDRRDSGRMMQVFQRAIIEQNDYDMDFRLTRPDGDVRYIRCEGRCEIDDDDDVIALYGIMQDTTIATKRELDLVKAKDSVERAYAAKTQFLANMSHELRTPLNAIIGFSEMIERQLLGPIGTEKYLEYIGGIRESGEHLLDLISDILDMSKIEAGKYELNLEKFNASKVMNMAVHMMEGRALDANIKIKLSVPDDNVQIVADRRAVMQMVLNLLSNAVKFSRQDGKINLELLQRDTHVTIVIKDEGIGIPANKLANITMPFEQAETEYTREYEGSGLGLAITKELAEIHGGSLHIDSTIDVGTTVKIRLPLEAKK